MAQTEENTDFIKVKEKSDDDYEKNITYISAGTLVLSLTFIEKIVNLGQSNAIWCLVTGWICMGSTLLINLLSHQIASYYAERCDEELRLGTAERSIIEKRNKRIRNLNWTTTATLSLGILFLIIFCSINAIHMSHDKKEEHKPKTATSQPQNTEQKGRTVRIPTSVLVTPPTNIGRPNGKPGRDNTPPPKTDK